MRHYNRKHIMDRHSRHDKKFADKYGLSFDGEVESSAYIGSDDDYENFLTKDYWQRRKKRRAKRKEYKAQGMSRGQARVKARLEAREEVPRVPLKEAVKRGWNTLKKVALVVPRQSARGLVALNYRGMAQKMAVATGNKRTQIEDKWISLGGNPDKLFQSVNTGKNKRAILCGFNCKQKLVNAVKGSAFTGADGEASQSEAVANWLQEYITDKLDYSYAEPVSTGTAGLVATATPVISALAPILGTIAMSSSNKKALDEQKRVNDEQLRMATENQKFEQEQIMNQVAMQSDPIAQINADPNLSPYEKAQAIAELNISFDPEGDGFGQKKPVNPLVIGGLLIGGLFFMGMLAKLRKRRNA